MKRDLPAYVYPKGKKGLLYFVRRGQTTRMHEAPGTPEFAAEYARLMLGRQPVPAKSMRALVESYRKSPRFAEKSPRTKADYAKVLDYIVKKFGDSAASDVRQRHIIAAMEANPGRFGTYIVQVMSILMRHAMRLDWRTDNPALGAGYSRKAADRQPWPGDKIEAFREKAQGRALLVFELCLGTGQRIGDVLAMQWNDVRDGGIYLRQRKTRTRLWIPLTPRLRAVLDATPRRGLTICAQPNGKPTSYRGAADLVMKVRREIGAEAYDIHALRHTTASELAKAGCSDELIQAVTGHRSRASVARYTATVWQKARAVEAMDKLEGKG